MIVFTNSRVFEGLMDAHIDANFQDMNEWNSECERIDPLGPTLLQRFGQLDIFVGAAGILGTLSPLGHITPEVWRTVIDTNLTANWRLVRTLEPLLKRSDAGRAIFVSADVARAPKPFWGAYGAAKAGLEAMARCWAAELEKSSVKINVIDPGPVATALRARAYPGEDAAGLKRPDDIAGIFVDLAAADCHKTGQIITLDN